MEALVILKRARAAGKLVDMPLYLQTLRAIASEFGWMVGGSAHNEMGLALRQEAAKFGCTESLRVLGHFAELGISEKLPRSTSANYYEKAVDLGDTVAKEALARLYERGRGGLRRNDYKAFVLLREALGRRMRGLSATEGRRRREQALAIGNCAFEDAGYGFSRVEDCWGIARFWWKQAAGLPDPYTAGVELPPDYPDPEDVVAGDALERLGHLCFHGLGVKRDRRKAKRLWLLAAPVSIAARSQLFDALIGGGRRTPRQIQRILTLLGPLPLSTDSQGKWQGTIEKLTLEERHKLDAYQEAATFGSQLGSRALALFLLLFEPTAAHETLVRSWLSSRGMESAPEVERIFASASARAEVRKAYERLQTALADTSPKLQSCERSVPLRIAALFRDGQLALDVGLLQWLDLRLMLAEITREGSAAAWRQVNELAQLHSELLLQKLRESRIAVDHERIVRSTLDIGPKLNATDSEGFPIPHVRARSKMRWGRFVKSDRGWDRITSITVSPGTFDVAGIPSSGSQVPLVTRSDMELALILALLEDPEDDRGPWISLEPFEGTDTSQIRWHLKRKRFGNPSWLGVTEIGKSFYYQDTLLFLGTGKLRSLQYPLATKGLSGAWEPPSPWREAENGGGVWATSMGRNAFVVAHRQGQSRSTKHGAGRALAVSMPITLAHIDGSEFVRDENGKELSLDGGRGSLRYYASRHASILSQGFVQMAQAFPVYERLAIFFGVYASLRGERVALKRIVDSGRLGSMLRKRREQYVKLWHDDFKGQDEIVVG